MIKHLFILVWLIVGDRLYALPLNENGSNDTIPYLNNSQIKNRVKLVAAANVTAYGSLMVALYYTWYKHYPQSKFHFFNDNKEWLQVDKAGHAWSAYTEGRISIEMWRWTGISNEKAIWMGGLTGLGYQSVIEILDGFSSEWGFSWGDYVANLAGTALLIGQEFGWKDQRILLKFSSHRNNYIDKELSVRANAIYGSSIAERTLKDYNAQTYWLSTNLSSMFHIHIATWLNVALGYSANGMFGANDNKWSDNTGALHDRSEIRRYRRLYLAPDIDFTKIKTKHKYIRNLLFAANCLKFPAPAIEYSNNRIKWNWLRF